MQCVGLHRRHELPQALDLAFVIAEDVHVPAVAAPFRELIEEALAYETDGTVALRFPVDGLRCDIDLPIPPP